MSTNQPQKAPRRSGITALGWVAIGCGGGIFLMLVLIGVGLLVAGIGSTTHDMQSAAKQAGIISPAPSASGPHLVVLNWHWRRESGFIYVEGEVRNLTDSELPNVEVVASFYDSKGAFLYSDEALVQFNPIKPRQTTPFTVMAGARPGIARCKLNFQYLGGETIPFRDSKH